MKILDELYYGHIDPHTRRAQPDARIDKIRERLICSEEKICSTLNKEQREWFEKCKELESELSELQEREMFEKGFCLATRIMAEVMHTVESPPADE